MDTIKKPKIEAIYPLTGMQQSLLFHHLSNTHDQGFLNVECILKGALNITYFEEAVRCTIKRHAILRTTIHWENLEKPLQLVHQNKTINLNYIDWVAHQTQEKEENWKTLKNKYRELGTTFEQGPLLEMVIAKIEDKVFRLLWPSHHLLLDGWSSQIILNDIFVFYDAISKNTEPVLEPLPTYKSYISWLNSFDKKASQKFWSKYFEGFGDVSLFKNDNIQIETFKTIQNHKYLSETETDTLGQFAKKNRVTPNIIVHAAWALTLSRYFDSNDLCFGSTVSGRSGDFPNIDLISGMFMNVQPIRALIKNELSISIWLKTIQTQQQEVKKFEHLSLDQIMSYANRSSNRPLFDSLFLFENYPLTAPDSGGMTISNFESGITSTYPVTMVAVPGDRMQLSLSVLPELVDANASSWILENMIKILTSMVTEQAKTIGDINGIINNFEHGYTLKKQKTEKSFNRQYKAPTSDIEYQLTEIWSILFTMENIGIRDNFFKIGGNSLMAIRMIALVEQKLNKKLPITILIECPTIEGIAQKIENKPISGNEKSRYAVPLRSIGNKSPLFCFHAGDGPVLFYKLMPQYVDSDRPVYAIQPKGIEGNEPMHSSIEEMSSDYLSEIEKIQENGPYNLLFYCYNAIAVEISYQLKQKGKSVNLIVVDSSVGPGASFKEQTIFQRLRRYLRKMTSTPITTITNSFKSRYKNYVQTRLSSLSHDTITQNLAQVRNRLDRLHTNYKWKKIKANCTLILCKADHVKLRETNIESWRNWCQSEVKVVLNSGNHFNQFEEPHVQTLGQYVEEAIVE